MYRFALEPRWLVRHVIAVVVLALFVLAAFWQLHRLHERRQHNETVRFNMRSEPTRVDRPWESLPYRRITGTGRFDPTNEVIVASRELDDTPGNDVLTPFLYDDGHAVLVDRGWVPIEMNRPGEDRFAPPSGSVRITGIALAREHKRPFSPDDPKTGRLRVVTHIDPKRIARQVPYRIQGNLYVLLTSQRPAQHGLPRYERLQPLTDGPHLSYAVQWFIFFTIGLIGYAALLRRVARSA